MTCQIFILRLYSKESSLSVVYIQFFNKTRQVLYNSNPLGDNPHINANHVQ